MGGYDGHGVFIGADFIAVAAVAVATALKCLSLGGVGHECERMAWTFVCPSVLSLAECSFHDASIKHTRRTRTRRRVEVMEHGERRVRWKWKWNGMEWNLMKRTNEWRPSSVL